MIKLFFKDDHWWCKFCFGYKYILIASVAFVSFIILHSNLVLDISYSESKILELVNVEQGDQLQFLAVWFFGSLILLIGSLIFSALLIVSLYTLPFLGYVVWKLLILCLNSLDKEEHDNKALKRNSV